MKEKIKELSLAITGIDQQLLVEELKDLKANLAIELDLARDRRLAQEKQFREFMSELWGTLRKIQARFHVDAQLLNLVGPHKAGEKRWQKENSPSNRCRTLDALSKKTH